MTAKETAGRDGKGDAGRARTREVKLAVFFTQDKVDDEEYPVRRPGLLQLHRHLRARARVRRRWWRPRASAAAPATSGSSPSSATAPHWICYPDVGIADLIPVPRLSRGA